MKCTYIVSVPSSIWTEKEVFSVYARAHNFQSLIQKVNCVCVCMHMVRMFTFWPWGLGSNLAMDWSQHAAPFRKCLKMTQWVDRVVWISTNVEEHALLGVGDERECTIPAFCEKSLTLTCKIIGNTGCIRNTSSIMVWH